VDDVCGFIASVELCKPYVEVREGVAAIFLGVVGWCGRCRCVGRV
jgi:hypothetical protein